MTVFEQPELVEFFTGHRNRPEDLHPSEVLPPLAPHRLCGRRVRRHLARVQPSCPLHRRGRLRGARCSCPAAPPRRRVPHRGLRGRAAASDRAADVVQALGLLHWEPRYAAALAECWRLAERRLFFDVPLRDAPEDLVGSQGLPGGGECPYLCLSWPRFAGLLVGLAPGSIRGFGYLGPPAANVTGMPPEVCFASFVIERGVGPPPPMLELPFEWPFNPTEE